MNIFSEILKFEDKTVESALGEFGLSLLKFSQNIDIDHFGISDVPIDQNLSNRLCQILYLVDYAIKNNLYLSVEGIDKFYNKFLTNDIKNLDKKFVRLLKDKNLREEIRKSKKISEISLIGFFEKARLVWDNLPEDFSIFSKNDESYKEMIKEAEIKALRYRNIGCRELSNNIEKSLDSVKKMISDSYFGYRRILIRNAAIILSKINQFKLNKKNIENSFCKKEYFISLSGDIYNPKIYPIHYLEEIKTDYINLLMLDLEKVPLFDHYMVLVPSIKKRSMQRDMFDIKEKNIIPIVLGEKDGKCYFISYWI
jgi:hypothetical protein